MSKRLKKNVPVLRFPEFDGDWNKFTLLSLLDCVIDYRGKAPPKNDNGIILITARNVKQGFLDFTNKEFISTKDYHNWMNRGLPQKGDILFTTEAPLGNVCMFPESGVYALGQRTLTLRAKSGLSYGIFLFYILQSPKIRVEILSQSTGSTAKGIKSSIFKKIPLKVPSLKEQEKIANFLGTIDTRLTQLRRKCELLQTYKRGVMQKLFCQKIRFKQDDRSDFPDWKNRKIKQLGNVVTGSTPSTQKQEFYGGSFLFVSPVDIQDNRYVHDTKTKLSEKGFKQSRFIQKGSILFVCIGSTIGKISQAGQDCITNQQINSIVINKQNFEDFVFFLLQFKSNEIKKLAGEHAVPIINKSTFQEVEFKIPCLEEQEKIANFLTAIDRRIETLSQQIELVEKFKKGLLKKMFV